MAAITLIIVGKYFLPIFLERRNLAAAVIAAILIALYWYWW